MLDIVSGWFSDWAERSSMGSSPKIRFALDSPLEGRVRSEPVSEIRSIPDDSGRFWTILDGNKLVLGAEITKNRNPGS
jgi:hypothetical protein